MKNHKNNPLFHPSIILQQLIPSDLSSSTARQVIHTKSWRFKQASHSCRRSPGGNPALLMSLRRPAHKQSAQEVNDGQGEDVDGSTVWGEKSCNTTWKSVEVFEDACCASTRDLMSNIVSTKPLRRKEKTLCRGQAGCCTSLSQQLI